MIGRRATAFARLARVLWFGGLAASASMAANLDPHFGIGGLAAVRISETIDLPRAIVVQPDGKILVGGRSTLPSKEKLTVFRLNVDGTRDASYRSTPWIDVPPDSPVEFANLHAMALQRDGKLVVAAWVINPSFEGWAIARLNGDGSLDPAFGVDGVVMFRAGTSTALSTEAPAAVLIQPDQRIVIAGRASDARTTIGMSFVVVRLEPNGAFDRTFGTDGKVMTAFGADWATLLAIARQPDGKLIVAGAKNAPAAQFGDLVIARYRADGSPDAGFGNSGVVVRRYGADAFPRSVVADVSGRIVVGVHVSGFDAVGGPRFELQRYRDDGELDITFGNGGVASHPMSTGSINAVDYSADGRFVVSGVIPLEGRHVPLARFRADGSFEAAWDVGVEPGTFEMLARTPEGGYASVAARAYGSTGDPWRPYNLEYRVIKVLAETPEAVEFYSPERDHYFVTTDSIEIAKLDAGELSGWTRTGYRFATGVANAPINGLRPVCRFYGLPAAGLDSHFYSASAAECDTVERDYPGAWLLESRDAFRAALPVDANGSCPSGMRSLYRSWNARPDSNHRYTLDFAVHQAMLARGYVAEGIGDPAVTLCVP